MDMQYVDILHNVYKCQSRDMKTESLAPDIQNTSSA